jgi:hypothetical protein
MDNTRYVVLSDGEDVSYAAVFKDGKLIGSHEQLDFLEELVDLGLAKVYNTSNPKLEKKFTPVGIDKITFSDTLSEFLEKAGLNSLSELELDSTYH